MTVYIEYVLIDNFVIDLVLLKAVFAITFKKSNRGRLLFCAFLGAITALLYPAVKVSATLSVILKICSGLIITLLVQKYKSLKEYLIFSAVFFVLTFALGGTVMGAFYLLGVDYGSELCIATVFIPAYFIVKGFILLTKRFYKKRDICSYLFKCEITLNNVVVEYVGFLDTGNGLYFGEAPVCVIGKKAFLRLIKNGFPRLEYVDYKTVMGKSKMPVFTVDELKIYFNEKANIYYNARLGVSGGQTDEYDLILHPALMGENYVKRFGGEIKKIS